MRFLDYTQRRTTVGRTPLDEWPARCRDLYLTTHNTHNRQTSMPLVGFELTTPAGERPQTYALDCVATGTGILLPWETVLHMSDINTNETPGLTVYEARWFRRYFCLPHFVQRAVLLDA